MSPKEFDFVVLTFDAVPWLVIVSKVKFTDP